MPMPRLHQAQISRRQLTVDGLKLTVDEDVHIERLAPDLQLLKVNIYCQEIILNGDTHDLDEPTPIWDALIAERGNLTDLSTRQGSIK